jgi:hypothetical protein
MSKGRLALLSLVAVLSFAVMAASASAAIKFEWKVGGKILEAGESREFTTTTDGKTFDLHTSVAGAEVLLLSSTVEVEKGAKIFGGKPGTNLETVIFRNVTVDQPAKCLVQSEGSPVGLVKTFPIHTEIVSNDLVPAEPLILFTPDNPANSTFVSLLLLNKSSTETCAFNNVLASVTGNLLALPLPQLTETLNGDLDFEAPDTHFVLSNGTLESAGLLFGATNVAHLTGLTLVILTTDEKYGAF